MHDPDPMPTARPGFATREEAVHAYAAATGRDIGGVLFHRVPSLREPAVVFAQLFRRWNPADPGTLKDHRCKALFFQLPRRCDAVRRGGAHAFP